ncbi:MAG TPA: AbgT family transporter [Verrucomicrobiota bacterium]|nr:AbgT family transporter [Verrucomicrobiota bacterium]
MTPAAAPVPRSALQRFLDLLERAGNKLPDPALIFVFALLAAWVASAVLSLVPFTDIDPRTVVKDPAGNVTQSAPIVVKNLLSPNNLTAFLARMVKTFTEFPPLGVVLVAMLGVGIAEQTGFIQAGIKFLLRLTPAALLSPMLILVAIISHSAGDTGYVLVIPLGGIIFAAAGRHPVAGIACAFAGVAGGFSASFLPSSLDPLLQGFTQSAAQFIDPQRKVNPLCNWYFMSAACLLIVSIGWWLTDRLIEPRLRAHLPVDGERDEGSDLNHMSATERRGFVAGMASFGVLCLALFLVCLPAGSPFRAQDGGLTSHGAPLMESIVPLIALFFLVPGIVHGYLAGTVKNHRDVIKGMAKSMNTMGYYLVMAFCAAQFTYAFRESNLGALLAIKGADFLKYLNLPGGVTIVGIILLSTSVNLLIGSASAKWALLAPILVPMLMQLGLSPELTQAAYRIGDSSTNIVTPLLPYFPLIVVYCQRHSKQTGIGTLISTMIPYSVCFITLWTCLLLIWWGLGIPLGPQASYVP